jgi:primosomal protein N' (replication factor Y) (superfamily II helicase)
LVGTQMVSKGLDFKNVALVGILDADSMISFPDFRAHERAFQLMTQVAGRAGRYHKRGKVVIQTMNPYHFVIQKVIENNYEDLALQLMRERKRFNYPPYYRTIK